MNRERIGNNIKRMIDGLTREVQGIKLEATHRQVAKAVGMSTKRLNNVIAGKGIPLSGDETLRLAEWFNVTYKQILCIGGKE